jgi:hypothetical protein
LRRTTRTKNVDAVKKAQAEGWAFWLEGEIYSMIFATTS